MTGLQRAGVETVRTIRSTSDKISAAATAGVLAGNASPISDAILELILAIEDRLDAIEARLPATK